VLSQWGATPRWRDFAEGLAMTLPPDPNQPTREEDDGPPGGPPPLPPLDDDDFPAAPPPPPEGQGLVAPKLPPPPPPLPPPGGGGFSVPQPPPASPPPYSPPPGPPQFVDEPPPAGGAGGGFGAPPPPPPSLPPGGPFTPPPPSFPGNDAPIGTTGEALAEGPRLVAEFEQPGLAKAIGGLYIGAGIWCIIWAIVGFAFGIMACPFLCVIPLGQLVLGIYAIKHGTDMLGVKQEAPHSGISGGLVACVIACDLISATCGVLCLIFAADGQVQQYYRDMGRIL
jgi:hypothetical protein